MIKLCLMFALLLNVTSVFSKAKFDFETFSKNQRIKVLSTKDLLKEITLETYDGKKLSLKDTKGKVVLLNFFATWCPPCVAELPEFAEYQHKFGERNFMLLAINAKEKKGKVAKFMKRNNFNFSAFLDPRGELFTQYKVSSLPSTFIIDKKGIIRFQIAGARDWKSKDFTDFFQALIDEK